MSKLIVEFFLQEIRLGQKCAVYAYYIGTLYFYIYIYLVAIETFNAVQPYVTLFLFLILYTVAYSKST